MGFFRRLGRILRPIRQVFGLLTSICLLPGPGPVFQLAKIGLHCSQLFAPKLSKYAGFIVEVLQPGLSGADLFRTLCTQAAVLSNKAEIVAVLSFAQEAKPLSAALNGTKTFLVLTKKEGSAALLDLLSPYIENIDLEGQDAAYLEGFISTLDETPSDTESRRRALDAYARQGERVRFNQYMPLAPETFGRPFEHAPATPFPNKVTLSRMGLGILQQALFPTQFRGEGIPASHRTAAIFSQFSYRPFEQGTTPSEMNKLIQNESLKGRLSEGWQCTSVDNNKAVFRNQSTKEAYVAFRGTSNWIGGDGVENFLSALGISPRTVVEQAQAARVSSELKKEGYQVTFTGHSYGGSLARFVGANLRENVVTFAAPGLSHVHAGIFSGEIRKNQECGRVFEYTNHSDFVPIIGNVFRSYIHLNTEQGHGIDLYTK